MSLGLFGQSFTLNVANAAPAVALQGVDKDYVQQAQAIVALSLLASRHAAAQLHVPKLQAFAALEIAEVESMWPVLQSIATSAADSAPTPSEADLEKQLVPLGQTLLGKLRGTPAGIDLAREYFLLEVNVHQQLLRLQEDYLKIGTNPHFLPIVKIIDMTIREHIALLGEIKTDTDSGKGTPRPGR